MCLCKAFKKKRKKKKDLLARTELKHKKQGNMAVEFV